MNNKKRTYQRKGVKKVKNAIKVDADGFKFQSKLEYFTYCNLLKNNIKDFKYEEEKFILIEPFEFNNESVESSEKKIKGTNKTEKFFVPVKPKIRAMTYLPDFTCINKDKTGWVIEVKGFANDSFPIRWKLFKEHLMKNGYNLSLYKPNTQENVLKTIELIKQKFYKNNEI